MAAPKEKIDNNTVNLHNIHAHWRDLFEENFYNEKQKEIKEKFDRVASLTAIDIINDIAAMTEIPREDRQQALMRIYNAMKDAMEGLEEIELPDVKWKDRGKDKRFMSPCQFVLDNYPTYGTGLTFPMIAAHDRPLYDALRIYKHKGQWPADFNLPTAKEENDRVLREMGHFPTLGEIADEAPPHLREKIRIFEMSKGRSRMPS